MKGKILLVVGLGVGYVLGTRAGREKYNEIKATADKLWRDPRVQKQVHNVEGFVKDKGPEAAEFLADGAKTVVGKVSGAGKSTKPAASTSSTTSSTSK